jgi:uroporphyrinogen decarboxylase
MRQPDFGNLLKVLRREAPDRPTLFEFIFNQTIARQAAGQDFVPKGDGLNPCRLLIHAFRNIGYDYAKMPGSDFRFAHGEVHRLASVSQNEGAVIGNRASFEAYEWPDPDAADYSRLERLAAEMPEGMKLAVNGPGGVLENAIHLVGYERLCLMVLEDPDLTRDVFDAVGSRLVRYYERCVPYETVGALISNDDWGFRKQTVLAPDDMRRFVFPWHKRIVAVAHAAGKPAILHSCGNLERVMDDVIEDIGFDGKHSFEDTIMPVEDAYERWGRRVAILGGIDVDFVCRSAPEEVYRRSKAMLERAADRGGYALGTGNSVPDYVPTENYLAMVRAALE